MKLKFKFLKIAVNVFYLFRQFLKSPSETYSTFWWFEEPGNLSELYLSEYFKQENNEATVIF